MFGSHICLVPKLAHFQHPPITFLMSLFYFLIIPFSFFIHYYPFSSVGIDNIFFSTYTYSYALCCEIVIVLSKTITQEKNPFATTLLCCCNTNCNPIIGGVSRHTSVATPWTKIGKCSDTIACDCLHVHYVTATMVWPLVEENDATQPMKLMHLMKATLMRLSMLQLYVQHEFLMMKDDRGK